MKVNGYYTLRAPIDKVWAFLMDPNSIAKVLPGCKALEETQPDTFEGTLEIGIAAVKGSYSGSVQLLDKEQPRSYRMIIDGNGKRGFVKGEASVGLEAANEETILTYDADTQVGGLIANVGQRMLSGAAKMIINQSLKKLDQELANEMAK
ncbi:carbon monoxide dehydrogenase [Candidatus Entotheonella serta]|nr:carbon monoxide dehydrogenase [Candidatus Entotheonella serta]